MSNKRYKKDASPSLNTNCLSFTEVQEEEPYHICPFDDAEEIGHLMRSGQEGSSDTESLEMQMPPPIPDSVRPNIENITLLVGP